MTTPTYHAVVFGASGINGWAIVKELLSGYPTQDSFSKITAILNRPLPPQESQWPEDGRLQVVSGIDLLADVSTLRDAFAKANIAGAETMSHVYYAGTCIRRERAESRQGVARGSPSKRVIFIPFQFEGLR